jgi:hypothetical protein
MQYREDSEVPLEAIEEGGGGFPEGEAVALGRGQGWGNGKGDHLETLVLEGGGGLGELPGIGEEQHGGAGVAGAGAGAGGAGGADQVAQISGRRRAVRPREKPRLCSGIKAC